MPGRIPCSAHMLTRNSAASLEAALASLCDFAEILIADGRSTDATLAIAARYGCRVVEQDPRYTDEAGRLLDYAGARSQLIPISSNDWIFYLDSDEILTPEAAASIAELLSGSIPPEIGAYVLRAKYAVKGTIIEDGSRAGFGEPRLFRRSAVAGVVGFVDEHFELCSGCVVAHLDAVFLKPLPPLRDLMLKWIRYLPVYANEATKKGPEWTERQLPGRRSEIRWLIRGFLEARRRRHPSRMPLRYEAGQVLSAGGIYATLWLTRLQQRLRRKS